MSGNPPDSTVGSENLSSPAPQPVTPQAYTSPVPQNVACPSCYTLVPIGTRYCPQCGNAIPPPTTWPGVPAPAPAPRRNTALIIVAVVLIAVLVLGIGGYLVYQQGQQRVLQAAKNSEANAANQSVNQLQFTCFSNRTDSSHLSYTQGYGYSGYTTVYEKFGISNPTNFAIDATWTITLNFPSVGWVLTDSQTFHEAPNGGVAHPEFAFTVTGSQLNTKPSNANFTIFQVTLDGTYQVIGAYANYTPTTHSTYDSTTSSGNGSLGTGSGLPKC
jgi:hypothetical protein